MARRYLEEAAAFFEAAHERRYFEAGANPGAEPHTLADLAARLGRRCATANLLLGRIGKALFFSVGTDLHPLVARAHEHWPRFQFPACTTSVSHALVIADTDGVSLPACWLSILLGSSKRTATGAAPLRTSVCSRPFPGLLCRLSSSLAAARKGDIVLLWCEASDALQPLDLLPFLERGYRLALLCLRGAKAFRGMSHAGLRILDEASPVGGPVEGLAADRVADRVVDRVADGVLDAIAWHRQFLQDNV